MAINKVVYGNNTLIDLTADTVTADKILKGYKAHAASGEQITGTSTFDADTQDATATADEILAGETAYNKGNKVTGTMKNNGGVAGKITVRYVRRAFDIECRKRRGFYFFFRGESAECVHYNFAYLLFCKLVHIIHLFYLTFH